MKLEKSALQLNATENILSQNRASDQQSDTLPTEQYVVETQMGS